MGPGTSHHFGPFGLDPESRVLTRDGTVVPLAPRTFDLLLVLVTSHGRLLTKDELLRVIWRDVNVEEASLAFQVSTLRKALGEHGNAWIETVPKHGYRFTADVQTGPVPVAREPSAGRAQNDGARAMVIAAACAVLVLVLGALALHRAEESPADPPLKVMPLTTYRGLEIHPSLSPDGSQIAFAWDGEPKKDSDIYVQLIGHGSPVPLTSDPRPEFSPAWSPDGRLIAFCRASAAPGEVLPGRPGGTEIIVVPAQGGAERVIARESESWRPGCGGWPILSWFPSSDAVATVGYAAPHVPGRAAAIYVAPTTQAPAGRILSLTR